MLHELGHFSVAKAVGMRVERFSLFFPPDDREGEERRDRVRDRRVAPAGGYVKITGMNPEELERSAPEVRAARLLQPAAVEAGRRDPRRSRS